MSYVSEATRLRTAAAAHRMAVLEGEAAGYPDALNAERAAVLEAKADALLVPAVPVAFTSAGEIALRDGIAHPDSKRTVKVPGIAQIEASEERRRLLDKAGAGVLAAGLALVEEAGATDSRQKMLAHQLALMHTKIFELMNSAGNQPDSVEQARLMNVGVRMMTTFQQGLLTLQKLKTGGDQRVTVTHVYVEPGAQAVIENVTTGGGRGSRGKKDEIPCTTE